MVKVCLIMEKQLFRFLWILITASCIFSNACIAQDFHFSQFYLSPLTQNPALAGSVFEKQCLVNYKNQWGSITSPFKTLAASFDMRFKNKKTEKGFWAGGINFFTDKAGDSQMGTLQANLNIAYHVRLNEYNTLGAGVQGGFAQRSVNYNSLQSGSQYDGHTYNSTLPIGETFVKPSYSYADISTGMVWTYDNTSGAIKVADNNEQKASVGFSIFHVTQPNYSFYNSNENIKLKYVWHGSGLIAIPNNNLAFVPGFMYCLQGTSHELLVGSLIRYKLKQDSKYTGVKKGAAFSAGGFLRAKDAMVFAMLLEFSNYAIGMSYDINISKLSAATSGKGGFEITLRFVSPNPFGAK